MPRILIKCRLNGAQIKIPQGAWKYMELVVMNSYLQNRCQVTQLRHEENVGI